MEFWSGWFDIYGGKHNVWHTDGEKETPTKKTVQTKFSPQAKN